ncbi:MAG: putrescine carbamoyltransferase, partial [Actinomycetes bacterium]|nr:putrescine carbamoyltransferase [Actinomycetes bacterium]
KPFSSQYKKVISQNKRKFKAKVTVSDDSAVLEGADFVYTDVWYGLYEAELSEAERIETFFPKYQVSRELLDKTGNKHVKVLHCLPANRGEEITDEVMDADYSLVYEEAENRLTAQRALLAYFIEKPATSVVKKAWLKADLLEFLNERGI